MMPSRRRSGWLRLPTRTRWFVAVLFVCLALVTISCSGVPTGPGERQRLPGASRGTYSFAIRLPPIHVWYTEDGVLTSGGVSTVDVYRQLGLDLTVLNLPPRVVKRLMQAGVESLEFVESPGGVAAYVNGEPLPAVVWDSSALTALGDLLPVVDGPYAAVGARLLPLLQFVQARVVVHFPPSQGAATGALQGQEGNGTTAPSPDVVARLEVVYDELGNPTLVAFDGPAWARWGIRVQPLALPPDRVRRLMEANVQHVRLISRPDTLYVYVNNRPLPRLVWDERSLRRALQLYLAAAGVTDPEAREVLARIVDLVLQAEVDVLFRFPVRPGVTPLPVLEPPHR